MPGTSLCRNSALRELSSGMTPMKTGTPSGLSRATVCRASATSNTGWVMTYCAPGGELAFELPHLRIEVQRVGIERAADDEIGSRP